MGSCIFALIASKLENQRKFLPVTFSQVEKPRGINSNTVTWRARHFHPVGHHFVWVPVALGCDDEDLTSPFLQAAIHSF